MNKQTNEYFREYYRKNADKKREHVRKSHSRPEFIEWRKEYQKKWRAANRDKIKAARERNREKQKARDKFKEAVDSGKILRMPCEKCGKEKTDGHHTDYSKPFDVMWLCRKHHMEMHRKTGNIT